MYEKEEIEFNCDSKEFFLDFYIIMCVCVHLCSENNPR